MNCSEWTTILVVLMTSCVVCCLATADVQSKASDSQQQLQQQQPQQQHVAPSSKLPYSSLTSGETESSYSQQEDYSGSSASIAKDDQDISVSARGRPHFVGKRKTKSFSSQWYPRAIVRKRSANKDAGIDNIVGSIHSVAKRATRPVFVGKRAYRYEARKAPWFIGKRSGDLDDGNFEDAATIDDEMAGDEGEGDLGGVENKRGGVPRFIGKRDPLFSDGREPFRWAEKRIPRFIGKRRIPKFIGKRKRPLFVGKRLSDLLNDEIFFENGQLFPESDKGEQFRFVARRNDKSDINFVNELSRQAELERMRAIILNDKRQFAPEFIGKRSELEDGNMR